MLDTVFHIFVGIKRERVVYFFGFAVFLFLKQAFRLFIFDHIGAVLSFFGGILKDPEVLERLLCFLVGTFFHQLDGCVIVDPVLTDDGFFLCVLIVAELFVVFERLFVFPGSIGRIGLLIGVGVDTV